MNCREGELFPDLAFTDVASDGCSWEFKSWINSMNYDDIKGNQAWSYYTQGCVHTTNTSIK